MGGGRQNPNQLAHCNDGGSPCQEKRKRAAFSNTSANKNPRLFVSQHPVRKVGHRRSSSMGRHWTLEDKIFCRPWFWFLDRPSRCLMTASTHTITNRTSVARTQRQVAPQARNEEGQHSKAKPSAGAVLITSVTGARMMCKIAFCVRHAVIQHTLSARQACDSVNARSDSIWSIFTTTPFIVLLTERFLAVLAADTVDQQVLELAAFLVTLPLRFGSRQWWWLRHHHIVALQFLRHRALMPNITTAFHCVYHRVRVLVH